MINYSYPLFRPPAEANSIIIQVSIGCSYNNCSFCSMYKSKDYKVRDILEIKKDIDILADIYPAGTKVFLGDGDALSLTTEYLLEILKYLQSSFVKLRRVSLYASSKNILDKSQEELALLCKNKLNLLYFGIETGSDLILKKITKGTTKSNIIDSLNIASKSGFKISATVILGIGGVKYSKVHVEDTAEIINSTTINYLSTLQLGLEEDAEDDFYKYFSEFTMLDDYQMLHEQKSFLRLLNPTNKVIFRSNHVSNSMHLSGTIPKDKNRLISELEMVID